MMQLLAIIGLITVAVLLWKAFGPQTGRSTNAPVYGPDDDPEFLWRLKREAQKRRDNENPDAL
jgi:hypothetical protein